MSALPHDLPPLPSCAEAYLRITGVDPRSSTHKPTTQTFAVKCVAKANHAHGDAEPSLHIRVDLDKWICRVCNAGGRARAMVVHAGLAPDLLAAGKWLCPPEVPEEPPTGLDSKLVARYKYHDESGELLYEVLRFEKTWIGKGGVRKITKDFSQRAMLPGGGSKSNLDGVRRVPYRFPEVIAAAASGRAVMLVEGEKDADAVCSLGFVGTTSPQGAQWKWTAEFLRCYAGLPSIYVVGDNDEWGRAAARLRAEMLLDTCGSVYLLESMPGVPEKGDVSDWIAGYRAAHPDATDEEVKGAFASVIADNAKLLTPEVDDGSDRAWAAASLHYHILSNQSAPTLGIMTGIRGIDEKLYGLQPGETTILASRTGMGKTTVAEHIIVENWDKRKILFFSLEMGAKRIHDRLYSRAQSLSMEEYKLKGRPDAPHMTAEWYNLKQLRTVGKTRKADVARMLEMIDLFEPELVIIDHLRHIPGWYDLTGKVRNDLAAADVLEKLIQHAAKRGHHNILLSQITREADGKRPELSQLRDSGSVEEMADNVIMLHRPYKSVDTVRTPMTEDNIMEIILRKSRASDEVVDHMQFIGPLMALQQPRTPEEFAQFTRCCR